MKQLVYFLFCLQFSSFGQCDSSDVVDFPQVEPQFPGGIAAMKQFIQEHIEYHQIDFTQQFNGRFYVKFTVCADGTVSNVRCERCTNTDLDLMGTDLVEKMPKWIPAMVKGQPVVSTVRLPITILLN